MFKYLFITNKPSIASFVELCGVNRIFIDLEKNGKVERQGHLDTVISAHNFEDIVKVKAKLNKAELMVRLNPLYEGSRMEVEKAISFGADILMLPMFNSIEEVVIFGSFIDKRVKFIPLIETVNAASLTKEISKLECVDEIHIGLNDLHLELKCGFMFELVANGYVENMLDGVVKPFGIGGIARVGDGMVPGELVMSQHVRLGSSAVILSRAFHLRCDTIAELNSKIDLKIEIEKLESCRLRFISSTDSQKKSQYDEFVRAVNNVSKSKLC